MNMCSQRWTNQYALARWREEGCDKWRARWKRVKSLLSTHYADVHQMLNLVVPCSTKAMRLIVFHGEPANLKKNKKWKKTVTWYGLFLTWLDECCRGRQHVWSPYFLLPTVLSVSLSPLTSNLRFLYSCHCLHYLLHTLLCLSISTISIVFLIAPLCLFVAIYFLQYER